MVLPTLYDRTLRAMLAALAALILAVLPRAEAPSGLQAVAGVAVLAPEDATRAAENDEPGSAFGVTADGVEAAPIPQSALVPLHRAARPAPETAAPVVGRTAPLLPPARAPPPRVA